MLSLLDVADPIICRMIEWDVSLNGSVLSHPRPSAEPNAVCTISPKEVTVSATVKG